eukprot:TRINITY_DN15364_c1_g1_i5.p1 TRINITY_DN15364_c1_g1~~TRINITY_DN15364_c1_g1_i5.p1  ORF type:complete len:207 (+),score=16.43 TRINITY_DN15364_c1_g1_i5:3-623(+)
MVGVCMPRAYSRMRPCGISAENRSGPQKKSVSAPLTPQKNYSGRVFQSPERETFSQSTNFCRLLLASSAHASSFLIGRLSKEFNFRFRAAKHAKRNRLKMKRNLFDFSFKSSKRRKESDDSQVDSVTERTIFEDAQPVESESLSERNDQDVASDSESSDSHVEATPSASSSSDAIVKDKVAKTKSETVKKKVFHLLITRTQYLSQI